MAAIGEEYGLRAERIRQIEAKAVRKLRHPSRSRYILMGMEGYINYLRDTAVDERLREYKKEIISLEKKIAELTDTEYEEEKNELENAPLAELDLSVRTFNILYRAGYSTVKELLDADAEKIVSLPNLGLKISPTLLTCYRRKALGGNQQSFPNHIAEQRCDIMKSEFDYYYGAEAEQFSFVKIPKVLFSDKKHFGKLSIGAKLMYGLLLDRMSLSRKNNWFDNQNRVYIVFPIEDIKEQLGICGETAVKLLKELDDENGIGLIKRNAEVRVCLPLYM